MTQIRAIFYILFNGSGFSEQFIFEGHTSIQLRNSLRSWMLAYYNTNRKDNFVGAFMFFDEKNEGKTYTRFPAKIDVDEDRYYPSKESNLLPLYRCEKGIISKYYD